MSASLAQAKRILSPALTPEFQAPESRPRIAMAALVLILASLALYNPVGHFPFVNYDDARYISDNAHVKFGLSWDSIRWAVTSFDESNWHPVTWLSHMLDCDLFGLNPSGHHYTNALLHSLNAALLFWTFYYATGFLWRSFMVAALFAMHPVNVESVAWIAERKNVLSLFFFLAALCAYTWHARRPGFKRYGVVAFLFALGLMSKPQVITLPFVLLLWDYWPLGRLRGGARAAADRGVDVAHRLRLSKLITEKAPLFLMCVPSAILTMKAQSAAGAVTSFARYSLAVRAGNAVVSYVRYLAMAIWPANLCVMYPYRPDSIAWFRVLLSAVCLASITIAVVVTRKRYAVVGWLWFIGTLVPMIGIIQVGVQALADRYAYLPFIGLFVALCWGGADFFAGRRISFKGDAAVCLMVLTTFAFAARRQIGYWKSSYDLWSRAAAVTTDNFVAEDGIGNAMLEQGDLEKAMPHFQKAVAIRPTDPISNSNLAFYKSVHGDLAGALLQYQQVTQGTVDERSRATAFLSMGSIHHREGDFSAAEQNFEAATKLRPRNVRAWIGLGAAAQRLKDYATAIDAYSHAVDLQPSDITYLFLAGALEQAGRSSEAEAAMKSAQSLSSNFADARQFVAGTVGH